MKSNILTISSSSVIVFLVFLVFIVFLVLLVDDTWLYKDIIEHHVDLLPSVCLFVSGSNPLQVHPTCGSICPAEESSPWGAMGMVPPCTNVPVRCRWVPRSPYQGPSWSPRDHECSSSRTESVYVLPVPIAQMGTETRSLDLLARYSSLKTSIPSLDAHGHALNKPRFKSLYISRISACW